VATHIQHHRNSTLPIEGYLVEAVRWAGHNLDELKAVFPELVFAGPGRDGRLLTETSAGCQYVSRNSWVCRTDTGFTFVMTSDGFEQRYDPFPCPPPRPTESC
jgi:hypothetical protein